MTASKPGTVVDNRFKLDALIGAGGFGRVYKAEDASLNRAVALKMLDVLDTADTDAKARFEREAKVLSTLRHAHIVSLYNYGQDESGRPYISMQFLDGQTLSAVLRKEGKLPWRRAVSIIAQVCEALTHAHAAGVVHRDLKPENIMLLPEPTEDYVQVLDFGLSGFAFGVEGALQKLTQTGAMIGTVYYMSPEVCRGQRADNRSDVYSLGCILYQCLSGELPITGDDSLQFLYKHVHELPRRLKDDGIPADLELVVFKAMQKEPEERFQSMDEFRTALDMVLYGKKAGVDLTGVKLEQPRAHGKEMSKKALPYILAVSLASIAGVYWYFASDTTSRATVFDREYNEGILLWTREEHLGSKQHLLAAIKAAPDKKARFRAELMAARYALLHTQNGGRDPAVMREGMELLRSAMKDAPTQDDRLYAQVWLGILAHDAGDLELTYELLNSEPKLSGFYYRSEEGLYIGPRFYYGLADALLKGKHRDPARAQKLMTKTEKPKDPTEELRDNVHIFSQRATSELGILQRSGNYNFTQDRPVQEITTIRYKVRHAESEKEMLKAIEEGKQILARNPDNKRVQIFGRIYIGLGYYDIAHFDEARKYIMDRPWTQINPGDLHPEWSDAGDCCVAALKLMYDGDADGAKPLLERLTNSGDMTEEFAAYTRPRAQFFLATAYLMKNDRKRADELFKQAMPHRDEVLFPAEKKFIDEQQRKRNGSH